MTDRLPIPADAPILELDAGNTRTKWRWLDGAGQAVASGMLMRGGPSPLPDWLEQPAGSVLHVRAVSVAGGAHDEALVAALKRAGLPSPVFVRAKQRQGRLVSGYLSPERLGADRWVAMLAASERTNSPFLVVDAGSAITMDLVDVDGRHSGGWIVPGLAMLRRALTSETAGIRFTEGEVATDGLGRCTADAVVSGTLHMARDFIAARVKAATLCYPSLEVFVTGGDGSLLASAIDGPAHFSDELVLDGLRTAVGG